MGRVVKALHVVPTITKLPIHIPKFNVKLPEGRKTGDYVNLTIDMRIVNEDGIYGAGMRVFINGKEFNVGMNAKTFLVVIPTLGIVGGGHQLK